MLAYVKRSQDLSSPHHATQKNSMRDRHLLLLQQEGRQTLNKSKALQPMSCQLEVLDDIDCCGHQKHVNT